MILVALVAFVLGFAIQGRNQMVRSGHRRQRVESHWIRARSWASIADQLRGEAAKVGIFKEGGTQTSIAYLVWEWDDSLDGDPTSPDADLDRRQAVAYCRSRVLYHETLMREWDRAARRSWSADPVEPPSPAPTSARFRVTSDW